MQINNLLIIVSEIWYKCPLLSIYIEQSGQTTTLCWIKHQQIQLSVVLSFKNSLLFMAHLCKIKNGWSIPLVYWIKFFTFFVFWNRAWKKNIAVRVLMCILTSLMISAQLCKVLCKMTVAEHEAAAEAAFRGWGALGPLFFFLCFHLL